MFLIYVKRNLRSSVFLLALCTFGDGKGTGGTHTFIGNTNSREQCAALVRKEHPTANGASYCGTTSNCKECYADFGATSRTGGTNYQTCTFPGTSILIRV